MSNSRAKGLVYQTVFQDSVKKLEGIFTFPCHEGKWRGCTAPLIPNLSILGRWVMNVTPQPPYPHEITHISTKYGAMWAPEPVWAFGDEKGLLSLPKLEPGIFRPVA